MIICKIMHLSTLNRINSVKLGVTSQKAKNKKQKPGLVNGCSALASNYIGHYLISHPFYVPNCYK